MITVKVRKTLIGRILFIVSKAIIKFRILKTKNRTVSALNKLMCNSKVFKIKVGKNKWQPLDLSERKFFLSDNV